MNLQMDPLDNPRTTRPIKMGCEMSIEPYPNWRLGWIDDTDRQFGNRSVRTRTRTRSAGPEPLPTLWIITTPKVGGTGHNHTAANYAVITHKFWVLNEQRQVFAQVVRLAQNRVPHTWLLKTGAGGYDNRASDLHQLSGVTQMRVLHGLMSRLTIMTTMIYRNLESRKEHTNRLTENGDTLQSDEPSSEIVRTINQGTPL